MIWVFIAIVATLVVYLASDSYDRAGAAAGVFLTCAVISIFLNLFLSFAGAERVKQSQCNLKVLGNSAYIAIVDDGDIAYQCDSDVIPQTVASYKVKNLGNGGPTASVYTDRKVSRFWSVFSFKDDSKRVYVYTPNNIATTGPAK